jgi:hypothetical protein
MHLVFVSLFNSNLSFPFLSCYHLVFLALIVENCSNPTLVPRLPEILQLRLLHHVLSHHPLCSLHVIDLLLAGALKAHFFIGLRLRDDAALGFKSTHLSLPVVIDEMLLVQDVLEVLFYLVQVDVLVFVEPRTDLVFVCYN